MNITILSGIFLNTSTLYFSFVNEYLISNSPVTMDYYLNVLYKKGGVYEIKTLLSITYLYQCFYNFL